MHVIRVLIFLTALVGWGMDLMYKKSGGVPASPYTRKTFWKCILGIFVMSMVFGLMRVYFPLADILLLFFGAWELFRLEIRRRFPVRNTGAL